MATKQNLSQAPFNGDHPLVLFSSLDKGSIYYNLNSLELTEKDRNSLIFLQVVYCVA